MKSKYERTDLMITRFDVEDVITTSGANVDPTDHPFLKEKENAYGGFSTFNAPGNWF